MLSHRSATSTDIPAILALADCCEATDQLNRPLSEADLTSPLWGESPAFNWQLWHDDAGMLVAFARLRLSPPTSQPIEGRFWLYVHPDWRVQGLEGDMIAWAETQTHAYAQAHNPLGDFRLFTAARSDKQERIDLLAEQGFRPVRYFFTMHRSFDVPLVEPHLPAGFTIRPVNAPQDIPAYVALGNAAFAEHWGHHDETEADKSHQMQEPGYRPDLDLLAIAPTGDFAGFCLCTLEEPFIQQQNGVVLGLGTHPRYRGIGLGRALLLTGLHRLQEQGLSGADISVDGENRTGAVKLYESAGFVTYETWISFFRP
jgi:mycothiol synthase